MTGNKREWYAIIISKAAKMSLSHLFCKELLKLKRTKKMKTGDLVFQLQAVSKNSLLLSVITY